MDNDIINIVLVCDDYYTVLLVAFLKSVEVNHKKDETITVFIVSDNISTKNKLRIEKSLLLKKMVLHWIEMEDAIPKDVSLPFVTNSYPLNIFLRILIPYFIPSNVKRVIYFDVDMIMLGDISDLWNIEIGDSIVGAVCDSIGADENTIEVGVRNYLELGLNPNERYFNSGLLIIDIPKWLGENVTQRTFDAISKNKKYAALSDQYGLNISLYKQWFSIDRLWGTFSINQVPNPYLIHYIHRKPIFKSYYYHYREEFYYYLNLTAWKGFQPIGDNSRYVKKVKNLVQKLNFLKK